MSAANASEAGHAQVALPVGAALLALLLWSGTAVANRYAVFHLDAVTIAVVRSAVAGLIALPVSLLLRLSLPRTGKHVALLLVSGMCSFVLWPVALSLGVARTSASHAALIMATLPVLTVLVSSIANRTLPLRGWWTGSAIALAGTAALVLLRDGVAAPGPSATSGDLIVFAGCLLCAVGYVAGGKLSPVIGAPATTFWGLSSALVVLLPVFILRAPYHPDWSVLPAGAWTALAWMALLSSFAGYALWFYALGHGGIARIASLQLLMPVMTLVAAILVLQETLTVALVAICAVIVCGTYIAHRNAAPARPG